MPRITSEKHPWHTVWSIVFLTLLGLGNVAALVVTLVQALQWAVWLRPTWMAVVWSVSTLGLLLVYLFYDWLAKYAFGNKKWGAYEPTISNLAYGYAFKITLLILYLTISAAFVSFAVRNGGNYVVASTCVPDATCTEMNRWLLVNMSGTGVSLLAVFLIWYAYTLYTSEEIPRYYAFIAKHGRTSGGSGATNYGHTHTSSYTPSSSAVSTQPANDREVVRRRQPTAPTGRQQ